MPARVWPALAGLIAVLLIAVVALDRWQVRQGEVSLLEVSWSVARPRPPSAPAGDRSAPRVAVVVDQLGGRRDLFEPLRGLPAPVAVAVLPSLPQSAPTAREAARLGLDVLLDLPMEPYRYPELDPGPGALLMSMPAPVIAGTLRQHLDGLPGVVGVTNHMGSRLTEDRARMRAVLEVLASRRLFLVDGLASSLSVALDEAKRAGLRTARRQILIDPGRSADGDAARWDEVAPWAEGRSEAVVVVHAHPRTAALLGRYLTAWEERGIRVIPVSRLAR
jgi:polysaccharide deacetylase 2 family uncharacterized protein YibQ